MGKKTWKSKPYRSRMELEAERQKKEVIDANNRGVYDKDEEMTEIARKLFKHSMHYGVPDRSQQKWYVLDTNVILSCVDILYDRENKNWQEPLGFKPSLKNAHLIVPGKVFEELDFISKAQEASYKRLTARIAIKRLRQFFPNAERTMNEIMHLEKPIPTGFHNQTISLLPLNDDFSISLPWIPEPRDNDGWIAVTALVATMVRDGLPVDGTFPKGKMLEWENKRKDVMLLTNDGHLQSKASNYTVKTSTYSFKKRPPYTGCRELKVPEAMFNEFYYEHELSEEEFYRYLPNEPSLIANEYIIMQPIGKYPNSYFTDGIPFANVARYHKECGMLYPLRFMKREGKTPPNARIAAYYDAMNDEKIRVIAVSGDAGTGKTFQAIMHAILEVDEGRRTKIVVITTGETKNKLGAVPGDHDKKMEHLIAYCKDAIASYYMSTKKYREWRKKLKRFGGIESDEVSLENSLNEDFEDESNRKEKKNGEERIGKKARKKKRRTNFTRLANDPEIYHADDFRERKSKSREFKNEENFNSNAKLTYEQSLKRDVEYTFGRCFECFPYEQIEGRTFGDSIIILDEVQRLHDLNKLLTSLTRQGYNSRIFVCGDTKQINDCTPEKLFNNGVTQTRAKYFDCENFASLHLVDQMRNKILEYETDDYETAYRRLGAI